MSGDISWESIPWESIGVVLAIAYLLLAARERIECWYVAGVSVVLYFFILVDVRLYMEAGLQVFYLVMAVYGFMQWRRGGEAATGASGTPIVTWPGRRHGLAVAAVAVASAASGWLLARYTDAAYPYLDAFTTWGAIVATFMVAGKVLENWLYWVVIDAAGAFLFMARGLDQTAALFGLYVVLALYGYLDWRGRLRRQRAAA